MAMALPLPLFTNLKRLVAPVMVPAAASMVTVLFQVMVIDVFVGKEMGKKM